VIKGFKDFIMRGNVVDLAVAVVIGAAFAKIVTAIVDGIITPLVAAIFGQQTLADVWTFQVNNAVFSIGLVLQAAFDFLAVAAAIYFLVVMPMNALAARRARGEEPEPAAPAEDIALLTEIRDLLKK